MSNDNEKLKKTIIYKFFKKSISETQRFTSIKFKTQDFIGKKYLKLFFQRNTHCEANTYTSNCVKDILSRNLIVLVSNKLYIKKKPQIELQDITKKQISYNPRRKFHRIMKMIQSILSI